MSAAPPRPRARIKDAPEDFVVVELPAYEPSGSGDHLYVRFTKTALTTDDVVRALADATGVPARDIGVAGLKDKVAVTTQTVSLPVPRGRPDFDDVVRALTIPGVVVHEAKRHGNKLKTGHLEGNRFRIVVRGLAPEDVEVVAASLEQVGREGLPNAFGAQRFGRDRDNAARALSWLTGKSRGPSDPRKRRFLWSALQSELFNAVLDRRVADGTWRTPLLGDLLKKTDTGGLFPCTDEPLDRARAERGEVSPTGPMFGAKMRAPTGRPDEIEREVFDAHLGRGFDLEKTKPYGEGTRRDLGLRVTELTVERTCNRQAGDEKVGPGREEATALVVCFVLPKGAYATSVLGAAVTFEPDARPPGAQVTEPGPSETGRTEEGERSAERAETELE